MLPARPWRAAPAAVSVLLFAVSVAAIAPPAIAQITAEDAVEDLLLLQSRIYCEGLPPADPVCVEPPTDEELRARIHTIHDPAPVTEIARDLADEDPLTAVLPAICAVLHESPQTLLHEGVHLFPATHFGRPGLLGDETTAWHLNGAWTGLLTRFVLFGGIDRVGVLTVAHTNTHDSVCTEGGRLLFVFGLDDFEIASLDGQDYVAVPEERVVSAECTVLYLRTETSDVAFYEVPTSITTDFAPYDGVADEVSPGLQIAGVGFPQGQPMRVVRGVVDPFEDPSFQRTFHSNLYAQDGLSGAPIFSGTTLVGLHVDGWAIRSIADDCLACPVPCAVRPLIDEANAQPERDCTEGGSWSLEAGYPQLSALFDLPAIEIDTALADFRPALAIEGGGYFLRADSSTRTLVPIRGRITARAGEPLRAFLPPGSRLGVLGRPHGKPGFRWTWIESDQIRRRGPLGLVGDARHVRVRMRNADTLDLEFELR